MTLWPSVDTFFLLENAEELALLWSPATTFTQGKTMNFKPKTQDKP
jgi:hypothetical protein